MVEAAGDLPALRAAVEKAHAMFGRLDILFADAGIQGFKRILDWRDADWKSGRSSDEDLSSTSSASGGRAR